VYLQGRLYRLVSFFDVLEYQMVLGQLALLLIRNNLVGGWVGGWVQEEAAYAAAMTHPSGCAVLGIAQVA
jgi:hypothetical protein